VHQLHTTCPWYCLQFRWNKNTKVLESNTWRDRFTILWCIDPNNIEFTSVQTKGTCDIELMKSLLDKIKLKYSLEISQWKSIHIVLDNARYQKSYKIQDYAKELWIELEYLAPYCPHLNIIERLWKRLKSKLKNRYFATFKEFCEYILDVIWSIWSHYNKLKSLLAMNFQII
jgi:transposase